jgi:sugar/nucleoside kinase (ribokinase family)
VIFDNYRPRLWASKEETRQVYQQMLACTDIAFLTLDDEDRCGAHSRWKTLSHALSRLA